MKGSLTLAVRRAREHDLSRIADLSVAAYAEFAPHITPEAWQGMQRTLRDVSPVARRSELFMAELDAELVGAVAYSSAWMSDRSIFPEGWASLLRLAVSPRYRRQGVATTLLKKVLERAHSNGDRTIGLYTSELMVPARRMYERWGFQLAHELPRKYGLRYWLFRFGLGERLNSP